MAGHSFSRLHYPLLDLQHYTNDSLDSVLGRHGRSINSLNLGIVDQPIEWLLYSDFAVVLAFVHLYTLFMVVPIFNSMMRIDKAVLEAARDAGASACRSCSTSLFLSAGRVSLSAQSS